MTRLSRFFSSVLIRAGWLCAAVMLVVFPHETWAAAGDLDTSFGDGKGWVTTGWQTAATHDRSSDVIQQADGKLVVAGSSDSNFALVRYNVDGTFDVGFGDNGKVVTNLGQSFFTAVNSVIQQADGKLVAAGSVTNYDAPNEGFILVRYNADGSLDTSFDGDGKVLTIIDGGDVPDAVIQQADGKLVAAGNAGSNGAAIALVRYNPDGSLDTTFDSDGIVTMRGLSGIFGTAHAVIQQGDGKLVVASEGLADGSFSLLRFNTDGSLDTGFDGDGIATTTLGTGYPLVYSVIQQADGKLVAAGLTNTGDTPNYRDFVLVRYNLDGSLDTGFDGDGIVTTDVGSSDVAYSVIQQADGKLVVVGDATDNSGDAIAVLRYNSDGSLDASFDRDGILTADIYKHYSARAVIQQADGKLLVVANGASAEGFLLVRYKKNGALDTSFNGTGKVSATFSTSIADPSMVMQQQDGRLVAVGTSIDGKNRNFAMARYQVDGALDQNFSGDGKLATDLNGGEDSARLVIQQVDGKLLVAGVAASVDGNRAFALVRYHRDGSLDAGFGVDGVVTTGINNGDYIYSIIQQVDGKYVAVGSSDNGNNTDFLLMRFNADGSLDAGFGVAGKVTTDLGAGNDYASAVIQQADGKLVVCGNYYNGYDSDLALVRYNADGTLDAGFDGDGILTMDIRHWDGGDALIQQTDGKLVVVAHTGFSQDLRLIRFNSDGSLDDTFDGVGMVTIAIDPSYSSTSLIQQADGKLVVVGYDGHGGLVLVRCKENGSLDAGFNGSGIKIFSLSNVYILDGVGIIQQADGKLVLWGSSSGNFLVARFESGQLDSDNDGYVDGLDNCPLNSNYSQRDIDGDGIGDACDADADGDGIPNVSDPDPLDPALWVDTDGDQLPDASDPLPNDASTLNNYSGSTKADKAGSAVAFAGDVNGDGYGDYVIGMPGYDIPAAPPVKAIKNAGRAEVISGKNGTVLMWVNGTAANDAMGFSVAGGADIDRDGYDDVVVGAPKSDNTILGLKDAGSVTVLYGGPGSRSDTFSGKEANALFGSAVALGDVNNDTYADIIIGAPKADDVVNTWVDAGSVTVVDGKTLVALPDIYYGETPKAYAGTSVATGKVDAVPGADVIIGAPGDDDIANKHADAGSVTVYNMAHAATPVMKKYGAVSKAYLGKSVAAGNVDGVAGDEVLAGAPGDDNGLLKDTGSVTVFFADVTPAVTKYGAVAKAGLGNSLAVGDVDGDGKADIIAGASKDDVAATVTTKKMLDAGSVTIWSGNGFVPIGSPLYGKKAKDYFGYSVSAGDINRDGKADLIIGIPGFDALPLPPATRLIKDAGAVQVLNGAGL